MYFFAKILKCYIWIQQKIIGRIYSSDFYFLWHTLMHITSQCSIVNSLLCILLHNVELWTVYYACPIFGQCNPVMANSRCHVYIMLNARSVVGQCPSSPNLETSATLSFMLWIICLWLTKSSSWMAWVGVGRVSFIRKLDSA